MANLNYLYVYSGWLDPEIVKRELPDAEFITIGTCEDYRLRYMDYQDDEGKEYGAGTFMEKAPGELLYGALWKISEADLYKVDNYLNLHGGAYQREYRAVMGQNGKPYAVTAHSVKNPVKTGKPGQEEAAHLLAGAREYGLPADYIVKLEAIC